MPFQCTYAVQSSRVNMQLQASTDCRLDGHNVFFLRFEGFVNLFHSRVRELLNRLLCVFHVVFGHSLGLVFGQFLDSVYAVAPNVPHRHLSRGS